MNHAKQAERGQAEVVGLGLDNLIASGDLDEPVAQGTFLELSNLVAKLKARREILGLSLVDVAGRSGLSHHFLNRLENGWNNNPNLDSLYRYALALDIGVTLGMEEIEPQHEA